MLRRSTMFIASHVELNPALQRSAMCFACSLYIPLLTERNHAAGQGYKHLAPPEQGTSGTKENFSGKPVQDLACAFALVAAGTLFFPLDGSDLFGERSTKLRQNFNQQVDLCEAYAPIPFRSKKEFEFHHPLTVSNEYHIVAPFIRAFRACFNVSLYVRGQMS